MSTLLNQENYFNSAFCSIDLPNLENLNDIFKHVHNPCKNFVNGKFPLINRKFIYTAESGAYWDSNRILFYSQAKYALQTTGVHYPNKGLKNKFSLINDNFKRSTLNSDVDIHCKVLYEATGNNKYTEFNSISISCYRGFPNMKENLLLLGIEISELQLLIDAANANNLSTKHHRYLFLEEDSSSPKTDKNGCFFRKYKLKVQGITPSDIFPPSKDIFLYTRDDVCFTSPAFAKDETVSKELVIVIDPGHGWKYGLSGTECRQFSYYEKNGQGERNINKIKTDTAFNLPPHVLKNVEYWIKEFVSIPKLDKKYAEWFYVIDVALLLKKELEKENQYKVLMTREVEAEPKDREQISGTDTYTARNQVPNDNNADYFISIHCDGTSFKSSGAFVLYPRNKDTNSQGRDVEKSRIFAQDITNHYKKVYHLDPKPIKQPGDGEKEGKFVLKSGNKTQRRVLVELGRMTNPNDIIKLYEPNIQEKMAKQLAEGIIFNITNSYAKE